MSGRKRKAPSSITPDFQKKKYKVGKAKRPRDNATDASFSTGRISIPTQLSTPGKDQVVSNRKLPIKVLFTQLRHNSTSKRNESLRDLREIFSGNVALLSDHFPSLLEHTVHLYREGIDTVRHSFYLLLKNVLPLLDSTIVLAYQQRLLSCLECGLTHIVADIRSDAVKLTSLFFAHHPALFSDRLLSFVLLHVQILGKVLHFQEKAGSSTPRKLPQQKQQPEVAWSSLLDQTLKFLEFALLCFPSQHGDSSLTQAPEFDLTGGRIGVMTSNPQAKPVAQQFCCMQDDSYHILPKGFAESVSKLGLLGKKLDSSRFRLSLGSEDVLQVMNLLMPLLVECWMEVAAGQTSSVGMPHLDTMLKVITTFLTLVRLSRKTALLDCRSVLGPKTPAWMKGTEDFIKQLLLRFPFSSSLPPLLRRELSLKANATTSILSIDVHTCELVLSLAAVLGKGGKFALSQTTAYLEKEVPNFPSRYGGVAHAALLSTTTTALLQLLQLLELGPTCGTAGTLDSGVLKSVLTFYNNLHSGSAARAVFNRHFAEMTRSFVVNGDLLSSNVVAVQLLVPWLESLPRQTVQAATSRKPLSRDRVGMCGAMVQVMQAAAVVGLASFARSLQENVADILVNLQGRVLPPELQRILVELVCNFATLDTDLLKTLASFLLSGSLDLTSVKYSLMLIGQRFIGYNEGIQWQAIPYLQFMLTLCVGYTQAELAGIQRELAPPAPPSGTSGTVSILPAWKDTRLSYKEDVAECVCDCLVLTPFSDQLIDLTEDFFADLLASEEPSSLPLDAVCRILLVLRRFLRDAHSIPANLHTALVEFLTTFLFTTVEYSSNDSPSTADVLSSQSVAQPTTAIALTDTPVAQANSSPMEHRRTIAESEQSITRPSEIVTIDLITPVMVKPRRIAQALSYDLITPVSLESGVEQSSNTELVTPVRPTSGIVQSNNVDSNIARPLFFKPQTPVAQVLPDPALTPIVKAGNAAQSPSDLVVSPIGQAGHVPQSPSDPLVTPMPQARKYGPNVFACPNQPSSSRPMYSTPHPSSVTEATSPIASVYTRDSAVPSATDGKLATFKSTPFDPGFKLSKTVPVPVSSEVENGIGNAGIPNGIVSISTESMKFDRSLAKGVLLTSSTRALNILASCDQLLADLLENISSILWDIQPDLSSQQSVWQCVGSLLKLLEHPGLEPGLRRCRPLLLSVGRTAQITADRVGLPIEDFVIRFESYCL